MVRIPFSVFLPVLAVLAGLGVLIAVHAPEDVDRSALRGDGRWVAASETRPKVDLEDRWALLGFFDPDLEASVGALRGLEVLEEAYGSDRLVVVGVTSAAGGHTREFLRERGIGLTVLSQAGVDIECYGIEQLPEAVLVDSDGFVVAQGLEIITDRFERGIMDLPAWLAEERAAEKAAREAEEQRKAAERLANIDLDEVEEEIGEYDASAAEEEAGLTVDPLLEAGPLQVDPEVLRRRQAQQNRKRFGITEDGDG